MPAKGNVQFQFALPRRTGAAVAEATIPCRARFRGADL